MVEGQPIPLKDKLKKLAGGVGKEVAYEGATFGSSVITGLVVYEVTNDPSWSMAATGVQIIFIKGCLNRRQRGRKKN